MTVSLPSEDVWDLLSEARRRARYREALTELVVRVTTYATEVGVPQKYAQPVREGAPIRPNLPRLHRLLDHVSMKSDYPEDLQPQVMTLNTAYERLVWPLPIRYQDYADLLRLLSPEGAEA